MTSTIRLTLSLNVVVLYLGLDCLKEEDCYTWAKGDTMTYITTNNERASASTQLDQLKEKIMRVWETRIREGVASAPSKSTMVLRSQLPELLENLISSILPEAGRIEQVQTGKIGRDHGEQRAALVDYTPSEVLFEYRTLRQVIFEVLEEEKLQISAVRDIILNVLDEGIEKAIERFFNLRSEDLKRSNRDLEHFAAIAAHDLKSPLATIIGFVELLSENLQGQLEVDEAEYIQAIRRSSARMTLLIDRLLEYSSVGAENKPFESVSTSHIVKNVMENLRIVIENSNTHVHFSELPIVCGDVSLLSQLFQNFISNAIKFRSSNRDPEIYIDAKQEGEFWQFSIQDNGSGFDPKEKENIFSLFKRLDSVKEKSGSGIGLATARKVIEIHGGQVWAESQPGVGSKFFFTLPKADPLLSPSL